MASRPYKAHREWNARGIAHLVRDFPNTPTKKIALSMGRPIWQVYAKARRLGLRKAPEYLASPEACRLRRGDNVGIQFRFKPGHVPANKGLRRPGWSSGRMRETQFKKGQVSKRWDPDVYTIGALRINSYGELDIKLKHGPRAWYSMARYTWRTERGPIPKGKVVRFRNGDNHDTRPANLRLGTRREVMLENTLHNYPKPIARVIQLRGALIRRINKLEKQRAQNA